MELVLADVETPLIPLQQIEDRRRPASSISMGTEFAQWN